METKNISAQEEQQEKAYEVINLKYEYPGYTGEIEWAVITSLSETELREKHGKMLAPYEPFMVLDMAFGEERRRFIRNEEKHLKRSKRGHIFSIDEDFEEHHPECCTTDGSPMRDAIEEALSMLPEDQARRVRAYYLEGYLTTEIAQKENVSSQAIDKSLARALKNLKKYLEGGWI